MLNALLRKQRIVVIVDRLSERSASTQQQIKELFRSSRVEALVITTRAAIRPDGSDPVFLYPQPLDSSSLVHFMTALLRQKAAHVISQVQDDEKSGTIPRNIPFSSPEDQLALGTRLAKLFRSVGNANDPSLAILPLPVLLFVEEAIRLVDSGRSLDDLPVSLPDVYFRYLERVNPKDPGVRNFMPSDDFLRASMLVAKLALGEDFVPKEFFRDDTRALLVENGWKDEKLDPIQRMLDNGILIEKTVIGHRRLRFALDPVAESLAASLYVRRCKGSVQRLEELTLRAATSPGFYSAVVLARKASANGDPDIGG
jgi:hypothetical protein